ncbi:MAG: hypothetical protein ACXADH_00595 [Candidatus Kariarchaeaceae archaeon]|jgi:hypothetical protein
MTAAHILNHDSDLLEKVLKSDEQVEDDLSYLMHKFDHTIHNGSLNSGVQAGPGTPCSCTSLLPSGGGVTCVPE